MGAHKEGEKLPQISFRILSDGNSTGLTGVHDLQARSYGYNDFKPFDRPDHYIRYIEPIETELATQVEYDMDEQDQAWLDSINGDRRKDQIDQASYETFEVIMDRLEKEWFDLMKLVPKPDMVLPSEDSTCAICDDGEAENSNAILFCDGCNLAVHQDCYGVPYIPEGQWLCRKCTISPENPVSCILCPNEGGAFKQTNRGEWAHLLCAIWVPEVTVGNQFIMEPIESIESVPKNRWKLLCSLCKERRGACIQCDIKTCFSAFHVSCARKHKLLMAMKNLPGQEETTLRAYCERHLPKQLRELRDAAAQDDAGGAESVQDSSEPAEAGGEPQSVTTKAARAHSAKFSSGPPLVPQIIVDRIMSYIGKVSLRKKLPFVLSVCKYWSLKRESRRGAPLLKRLHLEPWTAMSLKKNQTDTEKRRKLDHIIQLRTDLEKVRMLAELSRKREQQKLKQAQILQQFISNFLFPYDERLRNALVEVVNLDRNGLFTHPVAKSDAPGYYDVIKKPMTWTKIEEKLDGREYASVKDFKADIILVLDNAMLYNPPTTSFYRTATKLKGAVEPILAKLDDLLRPDDHSQNDNGTQPQSPPNETSTSLHRGLEAPLEVLEMLLSEEAITDGFEILLGGVNPIDSLFSFEFDRLKPRPPEPATPPTSPPPTEQSMDTGLHSPIHPDADDKVLKTPPDRGRNRKGSSGGRGKKAKNITDPLVLDTTLDQPELGFIAGPSTRARGSKGSPDKSIAPGVSGVSGEEPIGTSTRSNKRRSGKQTKNRDDPELEAPAEIDQDLEPEDGEEHSSAPVPSVVHTKPKVPSPDGSKKRKRADSDGNEQPDLSKEPYLTEPLIPHSMPPVVKDVGSHDSFLLFNKGWVLPTGVKRGGRQPVDRSAMAPLPSQIRKERKKSRLSVAATSASENQTLQQEDEDRPTTAGHPPPSGMAREFPDEDLKHESHNEPAERKPEPTRHKRRASGPQIEMKVEAHDAEPAPEILSSLSSADGEGDSSELSELEDDDGHQSTKKTSSAKEHARNMQLRPRGKTEGTEPESLSSSTPALDEGVFEGGTLVWAKTDSYPWFPAVVFEEDDEAIPESVHASKAAIVAKANEPGPVNLVRFYDTTSSWGWMPPSRIKMLGDNPDVDHFMLNQQRWKTSRIKGLCRAAYKRAMAEMETPEDIAARNRS